jgi:inorganic pyrophosphatase
MSNLSSRSAPRPDLVHVVIDTPKGSRNKYKFDDAVQCFRLSRILPAGAVFPFNYGFIPGTRGEDGDALDVVLIMDDPMPVGMVTTAKLIGVLSAKQTQNGETIRNDRLLAVPVTEVNASSVDSLADLSQTVLNEVEHFFESYNRAQGRRFEACGRLGPDAAERLVDAAIDTHPSHSRR